jgi:flagellin
MPLSINTNIASMTAQRSFLNSNASLEQSFERLSTGKRVNSAVDDAAGLAIGKDLESRVSGLNQAVRNVNDGISMVQIAEGSLDEVTSILQRMRDLAVQAANGSLSSTERQYLDDEMDKLQSSIDDVVNQAKFSDLDLIDSNGQSFTIQSGADASDTMTISTAAMSSTILEVLDADIDLTGTTAVNESYIVDVSNGSGTALDLTDTTLTLTIDGTAYTATMSSGGNLAEAVTDLNSAQSVVTVSTDSTDLIFSYVGEIGNTPTITLGDGANTVTATLNADGIDNASSAITTIDRALATVAAERAALGATQSQLESTVRNLSNVAENTSAAAGRIMDTDYAAETANLTKAQILQQAATSILAQANAQPQAVLSLLQ